MSDRFEVVTARLLVADVGVNGGVPGRASEVLAVTEGDVFALGVLVALGETKIDNVDIVFGALVTANKEVVGLNVSMDDPLFVHFLNSVDLKQRDNSKAKHYMSAN